MSSKIVKEKVVYVVGGEKPTMDLFSQRKHYHVTEYDDIIPDIAVFYGGPDVDPNLYGEKALAHTYPDKYREEENRHYWDLWPTTVKVGICYGGQWLNCMSGGAMFQDVDGHGQDHKAINLLTIPDTKFSAGSAISVTSCHHQMMIPHEKHGEVIMIANRAKSFKSGKDREIPGFDTEVIWYESTKSLCFQPHPEYNRLPEHREYFFSLLEHLMEK